MLKTDSKRLLGIMTPSTPHQSPTMSLIDPIQFKISRIKREFALQVRAELNPDVIAAYAEAIRAGEPIAPPIVFYDGVTHWLADGYCRVAAAVEAGERKLDIEVRSGTRRMALEYALRRQPPTAHTNEDKRHAVEACLRRAPTASDRAIGRAVGVSHTFVAKVRMEFSSGNGCQIETTRDVFRGESFYSQDTARIGRGRKTK
jgi:hypothetical protein